MKLLKPLPSRRFTPACVISPRHYTPKKTKHFVPGTPEVSFDIDIMCCPPRRKNHWTYHCRQWNEQLPKDLHFEETVFSSRPRHDFLDLLLRQLKQTNATITIAQIDDDMLNDPFIHIVGKLPATPSSFISIK